MAARKKASGQTKEERDRISRGRIESFIDNLADKHLACPRCKSQMDINDLKDIPTSVASLIKARYDKLAPSLQAVEQTIVDPRDKMKEEDLVPQLIATLVEKPHLLDHINELVRRAKGEKSLEISGSISTALQ